nr:GrBNV gp67-like protein [Apis mellifera nudivirus]
MDPKTAFKRAALYHTCKQSKILSNVNFEQSDTESLVELVNQHNSHTIRELPILVAKVTTKGALSFLVSKFPNLRNYIEPDNIRVVVESDELAYLVNAPAKQHNSLIPIVLKNLAMSAVGSSITRFKEDLLNATTTNVPTTDSNADEATKANSNLIMMSNVDSTKPLIACDDDKRIGDFGNESIVDLSPLPKPQSVEPPPSPPPPPQQQPSLSSSSSTISMLDEDDDDKPVSPSPPPPPSPPLSSLLPSILDDQKLSTPLPLKLDRDNEKDCNLIYFDGDKDDTPMIVEIADDKVMEEEEDERRGNKRKLMDDDDDGDKPKHARISSLTLEHDFLQLISTQFDEMPPPPTTTTTTTMSEKKIKKSNKSQSIVSSSSSISSSFGNITFDDDFGGI